MSRRDILTDEERRTLFGVPEDRAAMVKLYTLSRADLDLVQARRSDANRLGFAVQLALLRHPGLAPTEIEAPKRLITFLSEELDLSLAAIGGYGERPQTVTDHAREAMAALGMRPSNQGDLELMIEAAAQAAWAGDRGTTIVQGVIDALKGAGIALPTIGRIERAAIAGRARGRKRAYAALTSGITLAQFEQLDALLAVDGKTGRTPLAWLRDMTSAPKADNARGLLERLTRVRSIGLDPKVADAVHPDRFRQLAHEGRATPAHLLARYRASRRHAVMTSLVLDQEGRLTDAVLEMTDRIVGGCFTRGGNSKERSYVATGRDVGRLMRLFHSTIDALATAQDGGVDGFEAVDKAVGWDKLLRARPQAASIAELAEEDPLVRAADRWTTLRKFVPDLLEAVDFKAGKGSTETVAAVAVLRELNKTGRRELPDKVPMPFKKEWRRLIMESGKPDRRLWETALMAHMRNKLRSGDVWVERSHNFRRFDSYLLPPGKVGPVVADLGLPATADEWLASRARELDMRLKRFSARLAKDQVEGVTMLKDMISITPVRADEPKQAQALAEKIGALMPRVRITELLHEVARDTRFTSAFTNLRTQDLHDNENALLAVILADGSNLGLSRMAEASQGVTVDQLTWTKSAYIRDETYQRALATIINAHHALPIATVWGQGTSSSSDGQFFRSGKRGAGAGDFNAKYGVDPGFSFYTHVSDQDAPFNVKVISAATHEAPYVLDGLMHHGSALAINTHFTDTGGATDHVFALCSLLKYRYCPRLRDFPDRRLASFEPISRYEDLKPIMGRRIKVDVIREHWDEIVRLVASLKAGAVLPSTILRKLAAYERQNQLDLALQEIGRVERTLFMLDWLESPALRRRCQAGLNKSEQRHQLTGAICTFKQGRIADRTYEAQQFRASGLNLVIAAIVFWNSTYIADAVAHLRAAGEDVPDEMLAHTSPVGWSHIAFSGDFLWERAAKMGDGRRALNSPKSRMAA
jgi:TnpA family transposase